MFTPYFSDSAVYLSNFGLGTVTALALTIDRMYFYPIVVPYRKTFTKISFILTTAAGSSNARVAIYDVDATTGGPGNLIVDSGDIATTATGVKTATISELLIGGVYYLAIWCDTAISVSCWASGAVSGSGLHFSGTTVSKIQGIYRDLTYATYPADESGQTHTPLTSGSSAILGIK